MNTKRFITAVKLIVAHDAPDFVERLTKVFESKLSKHELSKIFALCVSAQYFETPFKITGVDELFEKTEV